MSTTGLPALTLAEALAVSQNPYAIVVRSKQECRIDGKGFVAALSNTYTRTTTLPNQPNVVLNSVSRDVLEADLSPGDISPVNEEDWPKMRDLLSQQNLLNTFGFQHDTTYDQMMIGGFQCLVNNSKLFEGTSFPNVFPMGQAMFCMKRPTPLLFPEYYKHICRMFNFNPESSINWLAWCQLIEAAALIVDKQVREGPLEDENRHYAFLQSCCAVCGPRDTIKRCSRCHVIGYCGREHQVEDFDRHKRLCKKYQKPGDAL